MKKIILVLLCLPLMGYAQQPSKLLSNLLSPIKTLSAQFQQTTRNNQGGILARTSGKLALQRPSKFRWAISKPFNQLLLADGKNLWFYDKSLEQVTVKPLKKGLANTPAIILMGGVKKLNQDFKIKLIKNKNNILNFVLFPETKNNLINKINIIFKNKKLFIMAITDQLGQTSKIIFSRVKINPRIYSKQFRFIIPKNTSVLGKPI